MRLRSVLSALAASAFVLVGTAQADAAVPASSHSCVKATSTGVSVCFYAYGEKVTVTDTKKDGRRAGARLWVADSQMYYSTRTCENTLGYGTTVTCDYSFPEGEYTRIYPGTCDGDKVDCSVTRNWDWDAYEVAYT